MFDDTIRNANTNSLIVANQLSPSENVLSMCIHFWRRMPLTVRYTMENGQVLEVPVRPPMDKKYNNNPPSDKMEFAPPLSSKLFIASAKSIDQYLSFDFQNIHATEASRYDDGGELFRALSPTLSDDPHTAQYIESTPNGQSGKGAWFYEQVMDAAMRGRTQYGETKLVFIPWHEMTRSFSRAFDDMSERAEFERSLKNTEKDILRRYPHVSLEQLKWRRSKLASTAFNMDEELFDQEYPEDLATAFLTSGTTIFTRGAIKRLQANIREPIWEGDVYWGDSDKKNEHQPIHNLVRKPIMCTRGEAQSQGFGSHVTEKLYNNLKVWRWPKKGDRIVLAADVGRGNPLTKDGDYSTICVLVLNELAQDELIMTWRGKLNTILFGDVCASLAWFCRYRVGDGVKAPMLVPEWTGPGTATVTYMDEKNLYEIFKYRMPGVKGMPQSKHLGWESNSKTKPYAVGWMVRMVETNAIDIPSREVVMEMVNYRQTDPYGDEGSYGGAAGKHDDLVSSLQIGCALLRLETATVPGDDTASEIDLDDFGGDDNVDPFDELAPSAIEDDVEGWIEDDDDESQELFWSA